MKTRLVTETESADWINSFLERFWLMCVVDGQIVRWKRFTDRYLSYEPVLSQTIIASTDAALAGVAPPGVDSIRMTTFTRESDLNAYFKLRPKANLRSLSSWYQRSGLHQYKCKSKLILRSSSY